MNMEFGISREGYRRAWYNELMYKLLLIASAISFVILMTMMFLITPQTKMAKTILMPPISTMRKRKPKLMIRA